jgi:hypothetical protein
VEHPPANRTLVPEDAEEVMQIALGCCGHFSRIGLFEDEGL